MTKYLLDTNVVLRFSNRSDQQYQMVVDAIANLLMQGDQCVLAPQILIELWSVATRPIDVNGLGRSTVDTKKMVEHLLDEFPIIEHPPQTFDVWLNLVSENDVKGKRTHDAHLVATMLASNIDHILSFNPKDFYGLEGISVMHPSEFLNPDD